MRRWIQPIKTAFQTGFIGKARWTRRRGVDHLTIALPRRGAAEGNGERKISDELRGRDGANTHCRRRGTGSRCVFAGEGQANLLNGYMAHIQFIPMISAASCTEPFSRAFWLQVVSSSISRGQRRQNVGKFNGGREGGKIGS